MNDQNAEHKNRLRAIANDLDRIRSWLERYGFMDRRLFERVAPLVAHDLRLLNKQLGRLRPSILLEFEQIEIAIRQGDQPWALRLLTQCLAELAGFVTGRPMAIAA